MNPLKAFMQALFYVSGLYTNKLNPKPGAVIEKLSAEARDSLKDLKSSDIDSSKFYDDIKYFCGNDYYQEQEFKKERLDFDKKMKK